MKKNIFKLVIFIGLWAVLILPGCYNAEEFGVPGTPEDYTPPSSGLDTSALPFPFDSTRQAGKWLIKDGNVIPGMITKKGITEFYSTNDRFAWEDQPGVGVVGRQYYDNYSRANYGLEGILPSNSYQRSYLFSNVMVPVGEGTSYYAYARMTAGTRGSSALAVLGGVSWDISGSPANGDLRIGLDGGSRQFFFDLYSKAVNVPKDLSDPDEYVIPGQEFDLEWVVVDFLLYFKINGKEIFRFQIPEGPKYMIAPFIRPWRGFVTVNEFYLEASEYYAPNFAMVREYENAAEGEKYGIIQNAALAKKDNDLLLFSEGRVYPSKSQLAESNEEYGHTRTNQNRGPAGNSDIIMKKSSDDGSTWSADPIVIAGANDELTYQDPQTISMADGTILLQYISTSGSPVNRSSWDVDVTSQNIYQQKSTDAGNTWSTPVDLTNTYQANGSSLVRTASAHGIEMNLSTSYAGRLLMPLTYGEDSVKVAFSDDGGDNWSVGNKIPGADRLVMPTVVEYNADSLMLISSRSSIGVTSSERTKFISYSTDGGATWSDAVDIKHETGTGIDTYYAYNFRGAALRRNNGDIVYSAAINGEKDERNASNGEADRGGYYHVYGGYTYPVEPKYWIMNSGNKVFNEYANNVFTPLVPQVPNVGMETSYAFKTFRPPLNHIDIIEMNGKLIVAGSGGLESDREGIVVYHLDN